MDWLIYSVAFILGGVVGAIFLLKPMIARSNSTGVAGVIKIKKNKYTYEMGDRIMRLGSVSMFTGTDIHIGKRLPHIFYDAYAAERPEAPAEYVFDGEEHVPIKGDEDDGFRVYASSVNRQLASSIFTPETIKELQGSLKYDIEILDRHVRVIVPIDGVPVGGNKVLQEDMLKVAKALMKSIDHRLESWHEADQPKDKKHQ